jgi:hypothetical protein
MSRFDASSPSRRMSFSAWGCRCSSGTPAVSAILGVQFR